MDTSSSNQTFNSTRQWRLVNLHIAFNRLEELPHRTNPPSIPTRVQDNMAGATISAEGVLVDLLTPILPNIDGETTREGIINLHWLISGNAVSLASNLRGVRHWHLALTMTDEEYRAQTGFAFVPPYNPGDYPQSMGNAQEQALGTENFRQNQALFHKYPSMEGTFKNQIFTVV